MSDESEPLSPEDAFALFGHDLRVSMLLELAEADGRSLPFSELRRRVEERDSGKFSYHLSKLEDRFVARDPDTDEYRLLYPGHHIIDTIQAGVYHEQASLEGVSLDGVCVHCGGPLKFDYDTVTSGRVSCRDCDRILLGYPFDPGGLTDRDGDAVARAYDVRARTTWESAHHGVCPVCSGRVGAAFDADVPPRLAATHDHPVLVAFDCEQCSYFVNAPVGALLTWNPEVVAFLVERDVDVRERRLWELPLVVDPDAVTVESDDPWRVAVTVSADEETRVATLDETVSVVAFE